MVLLKAGLVRPIFCLLCILETNLIPVAISFRVVFCCGGRGRGAGKGFSRLWGGFSFRITFVVPWVAGVLKHDEHGIVFVYTFADAFILFLYMRTAYFFKVEILCSI